MAIISPEPGTGRTVRKLPATSVLRTALEGWGPEKHLGSDFGSSVATNGAKTEAFLEEMVKSCPYSSIARLAHP